MSDTAVSQASRARSVTLHMLAEGLVLLAAVVLIFTGFAKAFDTESFTLVLAAQGLVPESIVGQAASVVIISEIVIGVAAVALMAVWGRLSLAAGLLAGMVGAFGWYAFSMVLFPPPEPVGCGCGFSRADEPADWPMIAARNAAAAVVLISVSLGSRTAPARH